jgi:hypothetical protein
VSLLGHRRSTIELNNNPLTVAWHVHRASLTWSNDPGARLHFALFGARPEGGGLPLHASGAIFYADCVEVLEAEIQVAGRNFTASEDRPFVFGRCEKDRVVGLDPNDMGISAEAGSIEFEVGLWWVLNRSRKRPLFVEPSPGSPPQRVATGERVLLTKEQTVVLVPGAVFTHRIDVHIPAECVSSLKVATATASGTITFGEVALSERDLDALSALFSGYLRPFPFHDARPITYQEAAELLGAGWTRVTVRKQVERLKDRFARSGVYFQGPRANDELVEHLLSSGAFAKLSLTRLEGSR